MPAPDVLYFLDCSMLCNHIAGDTHFYFMRVDPSPDRFIDALDSIVVRGPDHRHWDWLVEAGLKCEERFVRWWNEETPDRPLAALTAMACLPSQIEEFVAHYSGEMVDKNHTALTDAAIEACSRYRFHDNLGVMRRAAERAHHDLGHLGEQGLLDVADQMALWNQREARGRAEEIQAVLERTAGDRRPEALAEAYMRDADRASRGVVKRSLRFLSRLIGEEPTRILIGGGALRIRSKNCLYEIVRTGSATTGHGGSRLSIFTPDEVHLCDVCLYTPKVPIADHVASIVMHIQAGDEASILKIGNAYNVCEAAYAQPWLLPYLPARQSPRVQEVLYTIDDVEAAERPSRMILDGFERPYVENRAEKVVALREALTGLVEREFGAMMIRDLPRLHTVAEAPVRQIRSSQTVTLEFQG